MDREKQLIKFVTELIKNTISETIEWEKIIPPAYLENATDNKIPLCFKTTFKDKYFILFERRYKHYLDVDEYVWGKEVVIANVDKEDAVIWENTEQIPNLVDLFIQVQEKVSGMDTFLDTLFG